MEARFAAWTRLVRGSPVGGVRRHAAEGVGGHLAVPASASLPRPREATGRGTLLRRPRDQWQFGVLTNSRYRARVLQCACPVRNRNCSARETQCHPRLLSTAEFINTVAGRPPPSAERPSHFKALVSLCLPAKRPARPPAEVRSSGERCKPTGVWWTVNRAEPWEARTALPCAQRALRGVSGVLSGGRLRDVASNLTYASCALTRYQAN